MIKMEIIELLNKMIPMLLIFTVSLSSIRITYLLLNKEKIIFYKEVLNLVFMIYILILFYIISAQEVFVGPNETYNLVPFKEIFRYQIGSTSFLKNTVGNILLFVPFGLFLSYYLGKAKLYIIFFLTLISSFTIELSQRLVMGRIFDVDDIILNVFGGILGYILFLIFKNISKIIPKIFKKNWFYNLLIILLLTCIGWLLWQFGIFTVFHE